MNRQVVWLPQAVDDLNDIHWQIAGNVAAALKLFALTGVGTVVCWPGGDGPDQPRLYVPPDARYYAVIRYTSSVVYVERVLRSP